MSHPGTKVTVKNQSATFIMAGRPQDKSGCDWLLLAGDSTCTLVARKDYK